MPLLDWGEYLIGYLWEMGPTMPGAMGQVQLALSEIQSWQQQMGVVLRPWEIRLLRQLSNDYASESHLATDPKRPPPFAQSSDAARLRAAELARGLDTFLS